MAKKKKKEPKVEKVFGNKTEVSENQEPAEELSIEEPTSDVDDILGKEETPEDNLTEKQRNKLEKINNIKNKISKILKSSNIEIIDENFDDDYDYGSADSVDGQSQQDYDSLKALYGGKDKKQDELTLTIDEFDYTYIGQYLEEYDLMHMKNIKKVKIIKKKNPKLKKFLIISSIVLIVAVGAVLGFLFTREQPVYLKAVTLSQTERVYNLNGNFEDTGLFYYAEYSDGTVKKVKLKKSHFNSELSTGKFDRDGEGDNIDIVFTNTGTANLVFTYEGFNVTYVVTVTKRNETGIHAYYTSKIFDIDAGGYIKPEMLKVLREYDNDIEQSYEMELSQSIVVTIDGRECSYSAMGYYVENGTTESSVIKITYNGFTIELDPNKTEV